MSLIAVQQRGGLSEVQPRSDVKLAISGGQNKSRDAITGILCTILERSQVQETLHAGTLGYLQVFKEFTRWISPFGMSPRHNAKHYHYNGVDFTSDTRGFLMFFTANRDEIYFEIQANLTLCGIQINPYPRSGASFLCGGLGIALTPYGRGTLDDSGRLPKYDSE